MVFGWLARRRRRKLLSEDVPSEWAEHLAGLPFSHSLARAEARRLVAYARAFVEETHFEGCQGFEVTPESTHTIALQACRLILNLNQDHYRRVRTVLVYPSAFRYEPEDGDPLHVAGLAVPGGTVILSWSHVRRGANKGKDGRNVVYHEFAHKLDMLDGHTDGLPTLETETQYDEWQGAFAVELRRLRKAVDRGGSTLIDPYGSKNPAELFAESTEVFFERPRELRSRHRRLYRVLRRFYRQHPARSG